MAVKKKQNKISKVKRNNQKRNKLSKQGKLKSKRNKIPLKQINHEQLPANNSEHSDSEESDHGQGMLEMVEDEDISFLQRTIAEKSTSYSLLNKIRFKDGSQENKSKRKRKSDNDVEENGIEEQYEDQEIEDKDPRKRTKHLLPIKTKTGLVMRSIEEDEPEEQDLENDDHKVENNVPSEEADSDADDILVLDDDNEIDPTKPVSVAELFARRQAELQKQKFRIGVFCSGLLENPEKKLKNFYELLALLDDSKNGVTNLYTIRKLAAVSIFEVFRDILPEYLIKHQEQTGVKLKKDTLQLQSFETNLLTHYKKYLQKLEKIAAVLKNKAGNKKISDSDIKLAEIAIQCMCSLLETHPYFNFAQNIAQMLVPFLNHKSPKVRTTVSDCCRTVFKNDKRGDISLVIVRGINQLLKVQSHDVYTDALSCLLALRIQDVNLDAEKEEEIRQKKFMTRKQKLLKLSKRERKRNKKLEELEKEMLETKAEENKQAKYKQMTEITKVLFTIYFRILKRAPNSKVLSVALEGLSKFAHVINLEMYSDLVDVLNSLMQPKDGDDDKVLSHRDQLMCVQTVFAVLSGQGDVLNIDPLRFYTHLYRNLTHIDAGRTCIDLAVAVKTLCHVLIKRRKQLSQQRLIAFLKRCMLLSLHQLHNGTISLLGIIRTVMQQTKNADLLLDTDNSVGTGKYDPYLEEPEFCNAGSTALYELSIAMRHFHPTVRKMATNIACGVPSSGEGSLNPELGKLSPEQLLSEFDGSQMQFNPAVPPPKKVTKSSTKSTSQHIFIDSEFEDYCMALENKISSENIKFSEYLLVK